MEYISAKTQCLHLVLDRGWIDHQYYTFCTRAKKDCTDSKKNICQNTQRNIALSQNTQTCVTLTNFFIKHICLDFVLAVTVCFAQYAPMCYEFSVQIPSERYGCVASNKNNHLKLIYHSMQNSISIQRYVIISEHLHYRNAYYRVHDSIVAVMVAL